MARWCRGRASDRARPMERQYSCNIRYRGTPWGPPTAKRAVRADGRTRPMAINIRATRDGQRCLVCRCT
ncbi:hypothetical protein B296_00031997 [Ensete ventricosum]|uniref:Uncharacterized protein n=1 Tax=Ensete ventricosum TaxID=4639 RepID=A0A427A7G4_ENSVE|nr:hypothetical protein B296_00031997 [Ensete ventricosum]